MIWVTWRQHRHEAVIGAVFLIVFSGYLLLTGFSMYGEADRWGLFSCPIDSGGFSKCTLGMSDFESAFLNLSVLTSAVLTVVPALLGVFVGAPLIARELEHRTHVLAWTQSITKVEWFKVKVGLIASAVLMASSALAVLATWWYRPMDLAFVPEGPWHFFSVTGIVPVAYAVFALALGLAIGTLVRRTVPAMGVTLVLFALARELTQLVRPWFLPPLTKELDYANPTYPHDALLVSIDWVDRAGHHVSNNDVSVIIQQGFPGVVTGNGPNPLSPAEADAIDRYLHAHGLHYVLAYQPIDRFWSFQAIEAGLFLVLSVVLVTFTVWWLARRTYFG